MQVFECPKCGAVLNINGDEEYIVCEYCDSKIKLDLPHEEKHNEDAVKLRQIEVEREFKLKAIEKEEQEAAKKNKVKKNYDNYLARSIRNTSAYICNKNELK